MRGNDLRARFAKSGIFTVGELGFGSGLNFLCAWNAWSQTAKNPGAHLHFFSVEKSPWLENDLIKAHALWPSLASRSKKLRARLPPLFTGIHRIHLEKDVTLTLCYGDAINLLSQIDLKADAWFMDGFAPSKNPDMWSPHLFDVIAEKSNAHASFATFTVAGAVRRSAERSGFEIDKIKGYGKKREMLVGTLRTKPVAKYNPPWFSPDQHRISSGDRVAIIGAGIAGASLATSLARYGIAPTLFDPNGPASGASGNIAGLIAPRVDADFSPVARFHIDAYLYAIQQLKTLPGSFFNACGVHHKPRHADDARRFEKITSLSPLPGGYMEERNEGLFFPHAGVIDPQHYVNALIGDVPIIREAIVKLAQTGSTWAITSTTSNYHFDAVVIANAADAHRFVQMRALPLTASHGQIDFFANQHAPAVAVTRGGYVAPFADGLLIGATYENAELGEPAIAHQNAVEHNIELARAATGDEFSNLDPLKALSRAAVRCATHDWLPVVGPIPDWGHYAGAYDGLRTGVVGDYANAQYMDGLYVLAGLGSRGLTTAPLAAEMIAGRMLGGPAPVSQDIAETLHPARFFIRSLRRSG